jgi:hypothetical protein
MLVSLMLVFGAVIIVFRLERRDAGRSFMAGFWAALLSPRACERPVGASLGGMAE